MTMPDKPPASFNPFAFSPETNTRFNLLIVGTIMTVLNLGITLWAKLTLGSFVGVGLGGNSTTDGLEDWRIVLFVLGVPIVEFGVVLALIGLAYFRYLRHPSRIVNEKKLQRPNLERDQKFLESVQSMARDAGFAILPEIFIGPPQAQDGQAFGLRGHWKLRLGPRLKVARLKRAYEPAYRAIILHELAHIFNDDIQRSYFAESIWWAMRIFAPILSLFTVLAYVPGMLEFGLSLIFVPFALIPVVFFVIGEIAIALLLLQYIRRGALRMRELYADARGKAWGARQGLVDILSAEKKQSLNIWQRLWKVHPRASERLRYLQNPNLFFGLTNDLFISNGFLLGFVLAGSSTMLGWVNHLQNIPGYGFANVIGVFSALIYLAIIFALARLIASGIGVQIQRQALADQAENKTGVLPYLKLFIPALIFHLAFEAGVYLMPYDNIQIDPVSFLLAITFYDFGSSDTINRLIPVLLFPFWILFSSTMLFFWMSAIRFFSERIVGTATDLTPPLGRIRLVTIAATILLPLIYIPSTLGRYWLLDITTRSFFPSIFAGIIVFGLSSGGWLLGWLAWKAGPTQHIPCPDCGKSTPSTANDCIHCHSRLHLWLYAN